MRAAPPEMAIGVSPVGEQKATLGTTTPVATDIASWILRIWAVVKVGLNFVNVKGRAGSIPSKTFARSPLVAVMYAVGSDRFGQVPVNANGAFEFRNVPPGNYESYVTVPAEQRYSYGMNIVVAEKDLNGIELPINPNVIHDVR